jgi:DNA-binding CsgD family transcriptional regulator
VVLEGKAGVGKTCLIEHWLARCLVARARSRHLRILQASADQAEQALDWGVLAQLNRQLTRLGAGGSCRRPAPDADQFSVGEGLLRHLEALARKSVVVVVLEDLHYADSLSLQAARYALRRLGPASVLTVVSVRPPFPGPLGEGWRRLGPAPIRLVHLRGLDEKGVAALARARGRLLSGRTAARLCSLTEGNPLWVEVLLRELSDQALGSDDETLIVPRDVSSTIAARHAALSCQARSLVSAAAVLGSRFDVALAAGIAQVDDPAAALQEAEEAGMLTEGPGGTAAFPHGLVRVAVLGSLGPVRRSALHLAAAGHCAGSEALDHLAAATLAPAEPVAAELERAGRAELAASQLEAAVRHCEAAWRLSPPGQARRRRALLAMEAELAVGRPAAARAHAAEVAGQDPDPERDYVLGWLERSEGRLVAADELLRRAQAALEFLPGPDLARWRQRRVGLALERALLALARMAGDEARELALQALALDPEGTSRHRARALAAVALALVGDSQEALELLGADPPHALELHELAARGVVRLWADHLRLAYEDLSRAVGRMEAGEALNLIPARSYLVEACYRMGRLAEACRLAEAACEVADETGQTWHMSVDHTKVGWVAVAVGDRDAVAKHTEAIALLASRMSPAQPAAQALGAVDPFGRLRRSAAASSWLAVAEAITADNPAHLLAAAEPAEALLQEADPGVFPFGPVRAEALVGLGRLAEAERHLAAYEQRAERLGRRLAQMHAQRVRGMLSAAGGNRVAANQAFERALQAGARLGMPLEVARVHLAFARALIDAGDPAGARRQLGAAERLFASAGASGWAPALERLGVQLARLGGQHPKEHLTKRETRVAELAAQGLSNPEIAAALFLSRKTVEYHLSNVFTKLDITNRRVLADLFGTCDGIEPGAG